MQPLTDQQTLYFLNNHRFFNRRNYNYLVTSYLLNSRTEITYHLIHDAKQYLCFRKYPACYGVKIILNNKIIQYPERLIKTLPNSPDTCKNLYNPDTYQDKTQPLKTRLANKSITITEPKTNRIKRITF